jgi:putative hemolysin
VGDEGPAPEEMVVPLGADTYRVDAAASISELNDELGLEIPEGDYQTIAGFVLDQLGRIPEIDDSLEYGDLTIVVKGMDGVRIDELKLVRAPVGAVGEKG